MQEDPVCFSYEEVEEHCSKDDFWVVLKNGVYDLTEWITKQNFDNKVLLEKAGSDITIYFYDNLIQLIDPKELVEYRVGGLEPEERKTVAQLRREDHPLQ